VEIQASDLLKKHGKRQSVENPLLN
jgi:hypothetical protein